MALHAMLDSHNGDSCTRLGYCNALHALQCTSHEATLEINLEMPINSVYKGSLYDLKNHIKPASEQLCWLWIYFQVELTFAGFNLESPLCHVSHTSKLPVFPC